MVVKAKKIEPRGGKWAKTGRFWAIATQLNPKRQKNRLMGYPLPEIHPIDWIQTG